VVRLITTIKRGVPLETAWAIARIAIERRARGVVGLDLAGDERNVPAAPTRRSSARPGGRAGRDGSRRRGAGAESARRSRSWATGSATARAIEDSSVARLVRERGSPSRCA
jgi:hypothetical protein